MLDFRLETFLVLCKTGNYTKAANILHITQPAVSQHIKYLEKYYECKLFNYVGKTLSLTEKGEKLKSFVMTMEADSNRIEIIMKQFNKIYPIKFGATLTIGEYVMDPILKGILRDYPNIQLNMEVSNTRELLSKLKDGKIDFALLEGQFDKNRYDSSLFSMEDFIAVCSKKSFLATEPVKMENLFKERLILREEGSGSREIFEQVLYEHNLTISNFKNVIKIGNIKVIKELVKDNLGITFLYKQAVKEELQKESLVEVNIIDFKVKREFNFVFLKDSIHKEEYEKWFKYFQSKI